MNVLSLVALAFVADGGLDIRESVPDPHLSDRIKLAQIVIQRQTIIRIAPVLISVPRAPTPLVWKEKKGPKCIQMNSLAGLSITQQNSIDLVIRGGQRVRARLEKSCPSIDFYSGFYIKQNKDGRICQDRDLINSRTGSACQIDKFRTLVVDK